MRSASSDLASSETVSVLRDERSGSEGARQIQWVARRLYVLEVPGSSPGRVKKIFCQILGRFYENELINSKGRFCVCCPSAIFRDDLRNALCMITQWVGLDGLAVLLWC